MSKGMRLLRAAGDASSQIRQQGTFLVISVCLFSGVPSQHNACVIVCEDVLQFLSCSFSMCTQTVSLKNSFEGAPINQRELALHCTNCNPSTCCTLFHWRITRNKLHRVLHVAYAKTRATGWGDNSVNGFRPWITFAAVWSPLHEFPLAGAESASQVSRHWTKATHQRLVKVTEIG